MSIVTVKAEEYGLTEITAKNIKDQFLPMLTKMEELEEDFNRVASLPIEDEETGKLAKELRLKYVKVRTGTAEIHKKQKEFFLKGGKFVDGWKNAQLFASQGKEEKLKAIEDYFVNLEKERMAKLQEAREIELRPYVDSIDLDLTSMTDDVWLAYLSTKIKAYENMQEAIAKAEAEAEAKAKADEEERARLREENDRLLAEQAKARAERDAIEAKARAEREEAEAKAKAILDAERNERLRIERELQAKQEEENRKRREQARIEEEARQAKEKLEAQSITIQLHTWIDSFELPKFDKDIESVRFIEDKFQSFKRWAKQQVEVMNG